MKNTLERFLFRIGRVEERGAAELAVENYFPLEIVSEASYVESSFLLGGKAVTLLSDGVLEARECKERIAGLRVHGRTHHQLCRGGRQRSTEVGQDDDITVLTINDRNAPTNATHPR
jgi:hypothetical protein